jgi:hypothetical protein
MKLSRVQQAIKILKASAEELHIEEKPSIQKKAEGKKPNRASKKPTK